MKKVLFALFCAFGAMASATAAESPQTLLVEIHDKVVEILETEKQRLANEPEFLEKRLQELVDPHVDYVAMGRLMLGGHWKEASEQQRGRFVTEFRSMLARIYGKSIALYDGQKLEFLPFEPGKKANLAVVKSRLKKSDGQDLPIDFRLRHKDSDGWKIYDISVDNVSLVKNYKSSFQREIAQVGIDGLLKNIASRGAQAVTESNPIPQ